MSIASELRTLETNKAAIKAAIISMNPSVLPGDDMSDWVESIQSIPPPISFKGLTFTANEPGVVVNMAKYGSPTTVTLEYSTDAENWNTFDANGGTTPITLTNEGDEVYFRAGSSGNTVLSTNGSNYRYFTLSKSCSASGNIMSLLTQDESDWESVQMGAYCFYCLFQNCSFLTSAPELPATILASNCYANMFTNCTSLTSAPELPATALVSNCYDSMFYGCTKLTSAPELPATTLATRCYLYMFYDCTSLSSVEVAFIDWNTSGYSTSNWLYGVASTGTFTCPTALGTDSTITRDPSYCPSGWTVVNV